MTPDTPTRASSAHAQAFTLPDYPEDAPSVIGYQNLSAAEKFVYDWQPGSRPDEWRRDLIAVVNEALAAPTVEPATGGAGALAELVRLQDAGRIALDRRGEVVKAWEAARKVLAEGASRAGQVTLQVVVAAHCDDLERCVVALNPYPEFASTTAEIRVAITELRAALAAGIPAAKPTVYVNPRQEKPELLHWFDKAIEAANSMFHGSGSDDVAAQREIAECRAAIASIASNIAAGIPAAPASTWQDIEAAPAVEADPDYKAMYEELAQGLVDEYHAALDASAPAELKDREAQEVRAAAERTVAVIEKQLSLIDERAQGNYLDKRPVVQSLKAHIARLRSALDGESARRALGSKT